MADITGRRVYLFNSLTNGSVDDSTRIPLMTCPVDKCRFRRKPLVRSRRDKVVIAVLKFVLYSSGYRTGDLCAVLYSGYLMVLCWLQFVYAVYSAIYCLHEGCEYQGIKAHRPMYSYTARNEQIGIAISSLGASASYTALLLCVIAPKRRHRDFLTPQAALFDVRPGKLTCLIFWLFIIALMFCGLMVLYGYYWLILFNLWRDTLMLVGTVTVFVASWTSIASCFAFGISSLALGTYANDTVRRLKEMDGKHLDDAIIIHRELKTIVSATVDGYSKWFILHWFLYALTSVLSLIVVADMHFKMESTIKRFYFGFFFASNVFLFVFPCGCAAYVTTVCGAVAKKLNNTLSVEWPDGHLFKDRGKLQQFVSYANASPVSFKIGRVTFNTTIAWVSFFLGFTGLLFHFF